MEVLAELKAVLFPLGALVFILYPVGVFVWTVLEGFASVAEVSRIEFSTGKAGGESPTKRLVKAAPRPLQAGLVFLRGLLVKGAGRGAGCRRALRYIAVAVADGVRLVSYSLLLAPWFVMIAYNYIRYPHIVRGIRVGPNPRNYVDVILPAGVAASGGKDKKVPVVVAVMGGAWVIGHRAWNAHIALRLAEADVIVVAVDYRNFPFALAHEMVEDVGCALDWVFANIGSYGGDRGNVALIGQSAGAHLSAMVLLERSLAAAQAPTPVAAGECGGWRPSDLRCFVGVSGVYDMAAMVPHIEARGLFPFLTYLCAGGDLARFSPTLLLQEAQWRGAAARWMPPVRLFHGEADRSVPATSSSRFAEALVAAGVASASAELRPGMRHVAPVVEDPLTGGDLQVRLVLPFLLGEEETERRLGALPPPRPAAPHRYVAAVSPIMPF